MNPAQTRLCETLGYRFAQPELLIDALTHRSAGRRHNERLEFLGDAVLGLVIAAELYQREPQAREGELTRWRATLVNRRSLAQLARALQLGECLNLGSGELKSGGYRRDSILADTFEAVLGAIYLDGGLAPAQAAIRRVFAERLRALPSAETLKDAKTRLQELLQGRGHGLPVYEIVDTQGKAHEQRFTVVCRVEAFGTRTRASATSRRRAEQAAAELALQALEGDGA